MLTVTASVQTLRVVQTHAVSASVVVATGDPNGWDVTLKVLPGAAGMRDWVSIEPAWSTVGPGSRATFTVSVAVPVDAPLGPAAFVVAAAARLAGSADPPMTAGYSLPVTVFVEPLWTLVPDLSELDLTVGVPVEYWYTARGLPGRRVRLVTEVQKLVLFQAGFAAAEVAVAAPVVELDRGGGGRIGVAVVAQYLTGGEVWAHLVDEESGQTRAWSTPVAFVAHDPGGRYGQEFPSAV